MAEPATRVALLARPGAACENLQAALRQAGAEVVLVQDPTSGDPGALAATDAGAVLVALEPVVEDVIDRYDSVLADPRRLVIYDEVALAARREGWDAARWSRHLAAKLGGHADVLPPGAGRDDAPVLSLPAAPVAQSQSPLPSATAELAAPDAPEPSFEAPALDDTETFDADAEAVQLGVDDAHGGQVAQAGNGIDFGGFTPEMMAAMSLEPVVESLPARQEEASAHTLEWEAALPELEPEPASASTSTSTFASLEPVAPEVELSHAPAAAFADAPAAAAMRFSADEMSLVDVEPGAATGAAGRSQLAEASESGASDGAVVVLAGIGGPDAVRQFLSVLPAGFARPIIVRQRLDGGRHDRLVRQMQRATSLPVELAEAGRTLTAGHVYILPDAMTTNSGDGATTFVATDEHVPLLAGLPASDSAILVLSGTDPAMVPEALAAAQAGALVAGQAPEDSFDGAAAAALVAAGGQSDTAAELARRLSTRWLSLKD